MTNETQHTPGPWRIQKSEKSGWNIVDAHGNPAVARVYYLEADARLLAAAPTMYEALRRLTFEVRGCWGMEGDARQAFGNTNYNAVSQRLDEARAALAAARTDQEGE
jgi:hypothetical protein